MDLHHTNVARRDSLVQRRTSRAVLWVGDCGFGCGLSSDIVATAARRGWQLKRSSSHAPASPQPLWTAVQLANSPREFSYGYRGFDTLVAFNPPAGVRFLDCLRNGGTAWFCQSHPASTAHHAPRYSTHRHIRWFREPAATNDASRASTVAFALGLIAQDLPLSRRAWRAALRVHLPAGRLEACWADFQRGQAQALAFR